ncbi:MAG: Mur ligase family protein [Phycisphaerae bacterium]
MNDSRNNTMELQGKRVTVVGLGRFGGGVGVTRWLCRQGAIVTVSDAADAAALKDSVAQLDGFDVTLHLGRHDERDFTDADLLVVNPAVPKESPLIGRAEQAGVPRTSEINLFIERCNAPIAGITGSVGKSTTTAMAGAILATQRTTHVGGNIGRSLLETLPEIREDHVVVLELSSFQLEDLPLIATSPHVALVTNLTPNHLDRHGTMDAYAAAKRNIFAFQGPDDVLILNRDDEPTRGWADDAPGRVEFFGSDQEPFELAVPGEHNQLNARAAWAIARQFNVPRQRAAEALKSFTGLPHRLSLVAEKDGVRYFNDSKCTTPGGAMVAAGAFKPRRAILIVGGYDKNVSFAEMGRFLAERAKGVIALGATAGQIAAAVDDARAEDIPVLMRATTLEQAVTLAADLADAGDAVLLSPACASYDMFVNYEQRGDEFVRLVRQLK